MPTIGCVSKELSNDDQYNSFIYKNVIVYDYRDDQQLKYGQCYNLKDVSVIENKYNNPSSFKYKKYMASKGVYYRATVGAELDIKDNIIAEIKQYRYKLMMKNIKNYKYGRLINSLTFGEQGIKSDDKQLIIENGVSYLLAISGAHVSFLYKLIIAFSGLVRIRYENAKRIGILIVIGYAFIAGLSAPIIRATLMLILEEIFLLEMGQSIIISFLCQIFISPYLCLSQGFQLSYIATIGFSKLEKKVKTKHKIFKNILVSYCLIVILLPLTNSFTYKINIASPIISLLLTPIVMGLIYPMSLILSIIDIPIIEFALNKLVELSIIILNIGSNFIILLGHNQIVWWIVYAIIVCKTFISIEVSKLNAYVIYTLLWILIGSLNINVFPKVTFIDVGQGDSALIEYPFWKGTILIDGGKDNASEEVEKYLNYEGVSNVDLGFISHYHQDHYGGLIPIFLEGRISNIISPKQSYINGNYIDTKNYAGENVKWIVVGDSNEEANDFEVMVKIIVGNKWYLFPGDVEANIEDELVDSYCKQLNSDILKVGHHGSKTSSTDEFLDCVSPTVGVISSGKNNMYGHPSPEVIDRLNEKGIEYYDTQENGAIIV